MAPIVVGSVVSIGVLWWLAPRPVPAAGGGGRRRWPGATPGSPIEAAVGRSTRAVRRRRLFLLRGVGVVSVAAIAGGLGRVLQGRFRVATEREALVLPAVGDQPAAVCRPTSTSASTACRRS